MERVIYRITRNTKFGKTILALAAAHKLGVKTLVVCTTTAIRDMWIGEVRKWFGIEPGVIGSGKYNIKPPIVIGNIQTLTKKTQELSSEFGLLILDECHHAPASTFTKLLMASKARYKIGLSGTLKRKDGMQVLFKDFFGFKVFTPAVANTLKPTIHLYDTGIEMSSNPMIPWANKVTELLSKPEYRTLLLALANMYYYLGHKVIVVADRVELLQYLHEGFVGESSLFVGETSTEARLESQQAMFDDEIDAFFATQSIFSEGISQDNLSCMILATPIGDNEALLEQLAGRIMRKYRGKLDPVLVDLRIDGFTGMKHRRYRSLVYAQNGWEAINKDITSMVKENKNELAKLVSDQYNIRMN